MQQSLEERIKASETHVFKMVFPEVANHHNTMFGGRILLAMTEVAFMTAARFSRQNFVIVSCQQVDFVKPVPAASMVEFIGKVAKVGNKSVTVEVKAFVESIHESGREQVVNGNFILVAIDTNMQSVAIEQ